MDIQCCGYPVSPYSPACEIRLGLFRLFQMLRSRLSVAADRIIFIVDEALTVCCFALKYLKLHWCGECSFLQHSSLYLFHVIVSGPFLRFRGWHDECNLLSVFIGISWSLK